MTGEIDFELMEQGIIVGKHIMRYKYATDVLPNTPEAHQEVLYIDDMTACAVPGRRLVYSWKLITEAGYNSRETMDGRDRKCIDIQPNFQEMCTSCQHTFP